MTQSLNRLSFVEDDPDIRAVVEFALTTIGGFELDVSSCGAEAIEKIPRFNPDLILLDVMMPGMDGTEVFRRLNTMPNFLAPPVIFMTAKAQRHEVERYHELGASGVISKPFDPMRLADTVRGIWDKIQEQREAENAR